MRSNRLVHVGAILSLLCTAGLVHAAGGKFKQTNNQGLQVAVSDKVSKVSGPNEAALAASLSSEYRVKLPDTHPLSKAAQVKMFVEMNTTMSAQENEGGKKSTLTTTGPSANSWVNLVKDQKTGEFVGKGTMGLVWHENFGNIKTTRRAVAVTDEQDKDWYSNYGKNIDIAPAPVIAPE